MSDSRNHRIEVALLGSGYAALHLADFQDMDWMTDIVQTGLGRYATRSEAEMEARAWAENENFPFREITPGK